MEVKRITFKHYLCGNAACIKEYACFYRRVYRAVSKHHPHGTVAEVALMNMEDCANDYKLLGTLEGAVKAFVNNFKGVR